MIKRIDTHRNYARPCLPEHLKTEFDISRVESNVFYLFPLRNGDRFLPDPLLDQLNKDMHKTWNDLLDDNF